MAEEEATQAEEQPDASVGDVEAAGDGLADAVDDRAAALTGAQGAADTEAPVASNAGAVAAAEEHLEEKVDLADDRETLKKIQASM